MEERLVTWRAREGWSWNLLSVLLRELVGWSNVVRSGELEKNESEFMLARKLISNCRGLTPLI